MSDIPQVLGGLGQRQGVGCDGGCVGAQEPGARLLPQERVCLGDGGFLGEKQRPEPACPGSKGGRQGRRRLPYHPLLQLLGTLVLEDGQPVVKSNDHEGSERHGLISPYQAPLVRREPGCQAGAAGGPVLLLPAPLGLSRVHTCMSLWMTGHGSWKEPSSSCCVSSQLAVSCSFSGESPTCSWAKLRIFSTNAVSLEGRKGGWRRG